MIEEILTGLAGAGAQVELYRQATRPTSRPLSAPMASLLGKPARQQVPVLANVVSAITSKLFVRNITTERAASNKALNAWLATNGWELLERELWKGAVRDGRSFLLVTWGPAGPQLTHRPAYNGTEGAALLADDAAINVYTLNGVKQADIFYPNRIEKYALDTQHTRWVARRDAPTEPWPLPWVDRAGHPLGLALIPFGTGTSELEGALQIQADINEALLDLVAVSRAQGWPQRYITGDTSGGLLRNIHGQVIPDAYGNPIRREMKLEPGSLLRLEGEKATIGQLDAAKADRTVIDVHLELLSLVTGVPTHYFTGEWPSGVALLTAETRLNAKVEHLQAVLTPALRSAVVLMFALAGTYTDGVPAPGAVSVEWYPPQVETEDLKRERQMTVAALFNAGLMSVETAIAELHPDWTPEQVAEEVGRVRGVSALETLVQ